MDKTKTMNEWLDFMKELKMEREIALNDEEVKLLRKCMKNYMIYYAEWEEHDLIKQINEKLGVFDGKE